MHSQQDVNIRKVVAEVCKQSFEYVFSFLDWGGGVIIYLCTALYIKSCVQHTDAMILSNSCAAIASLLHRHHLQKISKDSS